jgi:hypothetical protein
LHSKGRFATIPKNKNINMNKPIVTENTANINLVFIFSPSFFV